MQHDAHNRNRIAEFCAHGAVPTYLLVYHRIAPRADGALKHRIEVSLSLNRVREGKRTDVHLHKARTARTNKSSTSYIPTLGRPAVRPMPTRGEFSHPSGPKVFDAGGLLVMNT